MYIANSSRTSPGKVHMCYSRQTLKRSVFSAVLKVLIVALALILFGSVFQAFAAMLAICNFDTSGAFSQHRVLSAKSSCIRRVELGEEHNLSL